MAPFTFNARFQAGNAMGMQFFHRRLWTGNVQHVCSATYQIFLNIFLGYRSLTVTLTLTLNPKP